MADNLETQSTTPSTVAPNVKIKTDELPDGSHAQYIKLLRGTADSETPVVLEETANGLKVDVAASVLPTGAATSARQDTGNAALASIDGKDFATQATLALVRAAVETIDNFISGSRGLVTEDNSAAIRAAVEAITAKLGTLGQKTMAGSAPVTIASDQTAIPITGSISANSSADVFGPDDDAGYTTGDLAKNLTQTEDGRVRVVASALVSDTPETALLDGTLRSLSMTSDGRLRVSSLPATAFYDFWGSPYEQPMVDQAPFWNDLPALWSYTQ